MALQEVKKEIGDQQTIQLSDEEDISIEQSTWRSSYKSKCSSEPVINFNDSFTTSRMGRQLSQTRENVDQNWLLSPCSSLPTMSSAVSSLRDDDVTSSRSSQRRAEGVDVYYDEIEHETYVYPLTERQGEPDGAVSPSTYHCSGTLPTNNFKFNRHISSEDDMCYNGRTSINHSMSRYLGESSANPDVSVLLKESSKTRLQSAAVAKNRRTDSQRSYNDELTEILLDFEKTLYANDNVIKPNPISSHATVIRGPITFV